MNIQSLGDLAQTFRLRQQNAQLKQSLTQLSHELASGTAADVTRQLAGNFGHLSDIEHDLVALESYRIATTEAVVVTSAMQQALSTVNDLSGDLSATALLAFSTSGGLTIDAIANEGRGTLDSIISALNIEIGGRSLFSGTETETTPLADAETLLTEIRTAVGGAATAADVITALDTFFDTPGGAFETLIYQGSTTFLSPYQLGEGESVRLELRADDPSIRNVLKNVIMSALADDTTLSLTNGERVELAKQSGERLLLSQSELISIRSDIGYAQSRVEQSKTRISTEMASLQYARGELLAVDKFRTATELENVQVQLETLYTLTARSSRLSLVNFLS